MIDTYKHYLKGTNLSENTRKRTIIKQYQRRYQEIGDENMRIKTIQLKGYKRFYELTIDLKENPKRISIKSLHLCGHT